MSKTSLNSSIDRSRSSEAFIRIFSQFQACFFTHNFQATSSQGDARVASGLLNVLPWVSFPFLSNSLWLEGWGLTSGQVCLDFLRQFGLRHPKEDLWIHTM